MDHGRWQIVVQRRHERPQSAFQSARTVLPDAVRHVPRRIDNCRAGGGRLLVMVIDIIDHDCHAVSAGAQGRGRDQVVFLRRRMHPDHTHHRRASHRE